MLGTYPRLPATRCARVVHEIFRPREGVGNAGRTMHPQPRMQNEKAYERSHHEFTGTTRHSRTQWFYGFLRALPGDRACCHPRFAKWISQSLMPASGRQDHTTSPSALVPFVKGTLGVHRIPFPTSVTIASRPSFGNETGRTGH
jgi:hypothetical protein